MKLFEWRNYPFFLLAFIFIVFIFRDWPNLWSVGKDLICAILNLFIFIIIGTDKKNSINEHRSIKEERQDEKITIQADQKTLKWLNRSLLLIFFIFIILYYLYDQNIILAVISIISLFFWNVSYLINIAFNFIYTNKYKKN